VSNGTAYKYLEHCPANMPDPHRQFRVLYRDSLVREQTAPKW